MGNASPRQRYTEIARVLSLYGFAWLWSSWGIGAILGKFEHRHGRESPDHSQAARLRMALEELGAAFIKVGQMLSTRADLLPAEYIDELSKLQDHARPVPYAEIAAAVERELGGPPDKVFTYFDVEPRAAGSIAQVHAAVLPDSCRVVVKVRRPGIEVRVEQDLAILGQIARFLTNNTEFGRKFDLPGLVDEFAFSLRGELDLIREGQNAERISSEFADNDSLHVPATFPEFSSHAILTMEDVQGIKISDFDTLDAAGIDRKALARRCAHVALVQVLDHGFFHADPHPGNFFVHPDGSLALIDYGMVGRLDDRMRESLVRLALAVSRSDSDRLIDELQALGAARGHLDRNAFRRDLDHILAHYEGLPLGDLSAGAVFGEVAATAQRHSLTLPSELVLVIRVIAMDEGLGAKLDPDFRFIEFAQPYFKRFWKRAHSVKAMTRRLREGVIDLADAGRDLPKRLIRIVGIVERGELTVATRIEDQHAMFQHIERAATRVSVSILTAALVVGLSVLALAYRPNGSESFGYFLLKALLALAIASGAWLLVAFWRSTR